MGLFQFFNRRPHDRDCQEVRDNASDYLEGEAQGPLAQRIRLHLSACRDCSGWVGTLRATIAALRNLPLENPPESAVDKARRIVRSG